MLNLSINLEDAAAKSSLSAVEGAMTYRLSLHTAMAGAVEDVVKSHLRDKYVPRNKNGNFWQRVHDSVEVRASDSLASVSLVELGIGLRYHGGEVRPGKNPAMSGPNKGKPTKALSVPSDKIPILGGISKARPYQMGLLAFLRKVTGGDTVGYLVEGEEVIAKRGKNKGKPYISPKKGGSLLYTLRSVTRHPEDKGILPDDSVLLNTASDAAADFIDSFED